MKRIFAILVVALLLLCGLCACNSQRVKIQTDSMSPTFQKGDWVTYEEVDPATLKVGDVIVFEKADGSVNVHRIVEVKPSETGELLFVTKADAVAAPDIDPVTADQIIGRAVAK